MKTTLLFLSVFLSASLFGQYTQIPDPNFEQRLITLGYDSGTPDGIVLTADIIDIYDLNVNGLNINDLTGIEDFIGLQILSCGLNNLTSLDLSQNTALLELSCSENQLTSLDLSNNPLLVRLLCEYNQLTSLDLTHNPDLWGNLRLHDNQLTSIDLGEVSGNSLEIDIYLQNNQLTSIDLSQCSYLNELYISNNNLTSLDISNNPQLSDLICDNNEITNLDLTNNAWLQQLRVSNNLLTNLNLSNLIQLEAVFCSSNQLTCLNVNNLNNGDMYGIDALNNPDLYCIKVDDADWAQVNWSSYVDPQASFSEDCGDDCSSSTVIINELSTSKNLIQILDMMGRETSFKPNTPLIYVYDDGSIEKVFSVEY